VTFFSHLLMPAVLTVFGLACVFSRKDLPGAFLQGAKGGLQSAVGLLPTLVILMTAVSMFSASGAPQMLARLLSPLLSRLGIPAELTPLLIVRPLSGSGSTALLTEIYAAYGPDSFASKCASVLTASSDTIVYVIAVYLSAAGVKKSRHTVPAALAVMLLGIVLSCLLVRVLSL